MFHQETRTANNNNTTEEQRRKSEQLFDEFIRIVKRKVGELGCRRATVRSMLPCSLFVLLAKHDLFVAGQKQLSTPMSYYYDESSEDYTSDHISETARLDLGFDNPFVLRFPIESLKESTEERRSMLEFRADEHIRSEFARVERELSMIQISPIFGAASFSIDSKLAFVLMPFGGDLDKFYENVIKPTVEAPKYGLVCKRADTVFSTQAIMLDIWKSICESRIIIADLTGHNPNVFYELGIAHTLGKDTILIYRKGRNNKKFPFDLFHIRRIEYTNDAVSGQKFINDLQATLEAVLKPPVLS